MNAFTRTCLGIAALLVTALGAWPVYAQGFMVKPMQMEAEAQPGRAIELPLEIRNTAGAGSRSINLRVAELSQSLSGSWRLIEADSNEDVSALASARTWTSLSADSVEIAPLEPATVTVRLTPPPSARGYYFAALLAETPVPDDATGVVIRVRFLIPLIVHIAGRSVRQSVTIDDASMTFHVVEGRQPTTSAHFMVTNKGKTFSRVRGSLLIERESDDRWRPVTRMEAVERSIIPGVTLDLGGDMEKRLPSGAYRLRSELFVDGRRVAPLEKEIAFEGDPSISSLAYDTALIMQPDMIDMDVAPGATRTTVVRIENPGTDPVRVEMRSSTPRGLSGVEMGALKGSDLSAEPWTDIRPAEFTLRPGRWQNVRVISRVPREGVDHPNYYADLTLNGTYADGQSAGETRSMVHLHNTAEPSSPSGMIDLLSIAEGDQPTEFVVQMRFANIGDVHLDPAARALLLSPQGVQVRSVALSGSEGELLPLGKRTYSATMSLAGVEPGYYALRAIATLSPGNEVTSQQVLRVEAGQAETADGLTMSAPKVTVLDSSSAELPEGSILDIDKAAPDEGRTIGRPEGEATAAMQSRHETEQAGGAQ